MTTVKNVRCFLQPDVRASATRGQLGYANQQNIDLLTALQHSMYRFLFVGGLKGQLCQAGWETELQRILEECFQHLSDSQIDRCFMGISSFKQFYVTDGVQEICFDLRSLFYDAFHPIQNKKNVHATCYLTGCLSSGCSAGAGPDGVEEIKRHIFFATIDWNVSVYIDI